MHFWATVATQLGIFSLEHGIEKGVCQISECEIFIDALELFGRLVSETLPTGVLLSVVVMVERCSTVASRCKETLRKDMEEKEWQSVEQPLTFK